MSPPLQHVVVGGGHNGLVCATLLARAGRSVLVLEAAGQVGGMAVTREFAPGCKVSAAAHLLDALPADILHELDLERHGLRFAARGMPTVSLATKGGPVVLRDGRVEGVSAADARAFEVFSRQMRKYSTVIDDMTRTVPFRLSFKSWRERWDGARIALRIRLLGRRDMRELLRIGGMNAYDLLEENFESEALKGALGFDASLGAEYAARSPGTVLTLLHRWAARLGAGGIAQPEGGMGAVTQAMARAAIGAGVQIRTGARVKRIAVQDDRASGVVLESGETIAAGSVISNADPRATFLRLVDAGYLDTDFVRRIDHFRARGLVAKVHLALNDLPRFAGVDEALLRGRLLVSPSLEYLEQAFNPSKYRALPEHPALEITVPSVSDPALAPQGRHVMSINAMFVPYELGADAQAARARLLESVLDALETRAPGLRGQVTASEVLAPADLEREFGAAGGHWHHGALSFDQFFFTRPVPGAAQYASPLPGLYLCGAGCHPGGGVMGLAGRNAARAIIAGAAS